MFYANQQYHYYKVWTKGYLCPQLPRLDLGDVGVCSVQRVQIHFVQLVVKPFPELPGQVVMTKGTQVKHRR